MIHLISINTFLYTKSVLVMSNIITLDTLNKKIIYKKNYIYFIVRLLMRSSLIITMHFRIVIDSSLIVQFNRDWL